MKRGILIFLFLIFILLPPYFSSAKVINKIVAVVGDEFLTLYDLEEMCKPYYKRLINPELPSEEKEKLKDEIRREILKRWIEESVLKIEAKKYRLSVTDEEVNKVLKEEIKALGGEKNFRKYLKKQGLSYEEYKKKLRDKLLKIKLVQFQVNEKVFVSEDELKRAYKQAIKNYDISPKYVLSILIINGDKKLASSLYERILQGENFEEIYKAFPQDVQLIKKITFKKEELSPDILKVLENISPGKVTPLIKKGKQFYIIRLVKMKKSNPPSFEKMKDKLYQKLFEIKAQKVLEKWIKDLEEKRYIKTYL